MEHVALGALAMLLESRPTLRQRPTEKQHYAPYCMNNAAKRHANQQRPDRSEEKFNLNITISMAIWLAHLSRDRLPSRL